MPLYMDVHNMDGAVTADDVAKAHVQDLAIQGEHDVQSPADEDGARLHAMVKAVHREEHLLCDVVYIALHGGDGADLPHRRDPHRHRERLEHDPLHVVLGLGLGQPERVDLHAVAEAPLPVVGHAVPLEQRSRAALFTNLKRFSIKTFLRPLLMQLHQHFDLKLVILPHRREV